MKLLMIGMVALCLGATAGPAGAAGFGFQVCNKSSTPVRVAAGYQAADSRADDPDPVFYTKGWWRIEAGECKIVVHTNARYVSVRAEVIGDINRGWFGELKKCVKEEDFSYSNRASEAPPCTSSLRSASFKVVDTGPEDVDPFTYTLN